MSSRCESRPAWTRRDILPTRGSTKAPPWTDQGDDRLRLMWREGVAVKCIARELGRSVAAIYNRVKILNLPWRPRANAAKPKPPPVVADDIERGETRVVPVAGDSLLAPLWTEADLDRLRVMWGEHAARKDIAKELGRSEGAVQTRACLLGLPSRPRIYNGDAYFEGAVKHNPSAELPPGLRYEDDPRASSEFAPLPAPRPGDVTAAMMGDPAPGRGIFLGDKHAR